MKNNKSKYSWENVSIKINNVFPNLKLIDIVPNKDCRVIVEDEFGICEVYLRNLLKRHKPTIISAIDKTQYIIKKFKKVHGELYSYDKVSYISDSSYVIVNCNIHGYFPVSPSNHLKLRGCPLCGIRNRSIKASSCTKDFIDKANKIHNNYYTYDKVNYINNYTEVIITCLKHGDFPQTPGKHLLKQGCKFCTKLNNFHKAEEWNNSSKNSNNFDSFKCYIIKCWNEEETFYKIGKTFETIKSRFSSKYEMPYNYEIENTFYGDAYFITQMESDLIDLNFDYLYKPKIKFGGYNECFLKFNLIKYG